MSSYHEEKPSPLKRRLILIKSYIRWEDYLGFTILILGVLGLVNGPIPFFPGLTDAYHRISPELIGIGITVLIIDNANEAIKRREEKKRLILQMGSHDNGFALEAVRQLRARDWLLDGSLQKTDLMKADLREAVLWSADLREVDLFEAQLNDSTMWSVNLYGAELYGANLQKANLLNANLQNASLIKANLQEAFLVDANLENTNLEEANLQDANMKDANLVKAQLYGTNLQGAYLENANLKESILVGANLRDSYVTSEQLASVWCLGNT